MSDPAEGPSRGTGRRRRSRRRLLRSGVAAASFGLAGCLGVLSGDGGDDGTGNESENATPPAGGNGTDAEPGPAPTIEAWPQFQYDAGNSGNPPGSGPTGELEVDWRFERGEAFWGGPVISEDGTVVCGCDDESLYAFDLEDGSLLWETQGVGRLRTSPAVFEDMVIVSHGTGLSAFDLETGGKQWVSESITGTKTPTVTDGLVVVPSNTDDRLHGLDAGSGGHLWEYDVDYATQRTAAVAAGTAYIADFGNEVHAVSVEDGTPRFSVSIDEAVSTPPSVVDGTIYVGGRDGGVHALDTTRLGQEVWSVSPGGSVRASLAVGEGMLASVDAHGDESNIFVTSRQDGATSWSQRLSGFPTRCPPVITGNAIYGGGGLGTLKAFDAGSGEQSASVSVDDFGIFGAATARDTVIVGTNSSVVAVRGMTVHE